MTRPVIARLSVFTIETLVVRPLEDLRCRPEALLDPWL
jgi:hypothetical protein